MLFIGNSSIGESAWVPTGDDPVPTETLASNDVDFETRTDFLDSRDTAVVSYWKS